MKIKYIILLLILAPYILHAQHREKINQNWQFQRLSDNTIKREISNQGTDWHAQFNISHVSSNVSKDSTELSVPLEQIYDELSVLSTDKWETVSIPHTPFIEDLTVLHQWQGVCYYKKELNLSAEFQGKNIWLEFEGAMSLADIWINGKHIMQNAGGYLPFVVDISSEARFDRPNEILVRLDNRDNPLIPPGKPLNTLDFCYYGGLYRDVNLIIKNENYISHPIKADKVASGGIFVTYPSVSKSKATIQIQTHIIKTKPSDLKLKHTLYEIDGLFTNHKQGKKVATETSSLVSTGEMEHLASFDVSEPRLWSPEAPYLYLLVTELLDGKNIVDREQTRLGIRHLEMSKERGFVLNGEPLRLVGSNRHMEYPYIGNALSDNAQYRDIYQIRENGFNTVRLGHYPQDKSVLDACDELGILVIEPIPGWQFFNKSKTFIDLTYRDVRAMIRRDRNHPSIIMWEIILNESWPPAEWKDSVQAIAHQEFPGEQCFTSGDAYGYDGFDVSYNDWADGFQRPNNTSNPSFIREYYDFEFGGHHSSTRKKRGDGEQALLTNAWNAQWSHNRYRAQYPSAMGDAVWSMYDYNRGCCDNICYSGLADIFRLPKFSLHFFKSQTSVGSSRPSGIVEPSVYVANFWTERADSSKQVIVYGNVEEVELRVNGRSVARQHKDGGMDSDYSADKSGWYTGGDSFDGGNGNNLAEAPFTFDGVEWERGELEAVSYIDGKEVTREMVRTPKEASSLEITYFESGRSVTRDDVIIVYVSLLDSNGVLMVTDNDTVVSLSVEGGTIRGSGVIALEAGIASFVVSTDDLSGRLVLFAEGGGLDGRLVLGLR